MARPQKENGYIAIAFEIWEALIRTRIPGQAMQVLMVILRQTYGWDKKEDQISLSQFQKATGLSKVAVCKMIKKLLDMKLITKKGNGVDTGAIAVYSFQKDYELWKPLPKKVTLPKKVIPITQKGNNPLPKKDTTTSNSTVHNVQLDMMPKIHPLQKIINENYPNIKKLKYQLAYDQAEKLKKDYSEYDISDYFLRMENYKPLAKKNNSVYLTFKNWHRGDNPVKAEIKVRLPKCPDGHENTFVKINFKHYYILACNFKGCLKQLKVIK